MRKQRMIPALALVAALSVAACGESGGSKAQGGDPDNQAQGYAPEQGQGTTVNDTAAHRPGSPAAPGQQP